MLINFCFVQNQAPSRSKKLRMTFANFLDLGVPHSQPKRKLINISGERAHFRSGQNSVRLTTERLHPLLLTTQRLHHSLQSSEDLQ